MNRLALLILAVALAGAVQAAETGTVVEAFGCTFNPGQTMADFDKATKAWQADMDKIPGSDEYFAATLVPFRANTNGVDVFWLGSYPNLNSWAKNTALYEASAEGKAADARFDKVAKCASGLYFSELLHEGLPAPTAGDSSSVIEGYQCTLNKGRTMTNARHANQMWADWVKATPDAAKFNAYMLTPWLANTPFDLIYLSVNDNMEDFGRTNTLAITTGAGQAVQAAFDEAMSCEAGLFIGTAVRRPAAPAQ